jgi:hypothetical protein
LAVPHSMSGAQKATIAGTLSGTIAGSQMAPIVPIA